MESLFGIIGILFFFFGVPALKVFIDSYTREATIKSKLERGALKARICDKFVEDNEGNALPMKVIEGNGYFPIDLDTEVTFITHLFDKTEGAKFPVHCLLHDFKSKNGLDFECRREFGWLTRTHHTVGWVALGIIPLGLIVPPYSGKRKFVASIHIQSELSSWKKELEFEYTFTRKGYKEAAADRDTGRLLALQLGIAVAGSDGHYAKSEGQVIKNWILGKLDPLPEKEKQEQKKIFNDTVKEAFIKSNEGFSSLSTITQELNRIDDISIKYEAIDLCFKVLAADGKVDPAEMTIIKNLSKVLKLNTEEVSKMKDRAILDLDMTLDSSPDIEDLIGVQKNWDNDTKRKFLRKEFQKWNNRLSILPEGSERANAQRMLDLIAEARKKL